MSQDYYPGAELGKAEQRMRDELEERVAQLEAEGTLSLDMSGLEEQKVKKDQRALPSQKGMIFDVPEPAPMVFDPVTGEVLGGSAVHMLAAHVDVRKATEIEHIITKEYSLHGRRAISDEITQFWGHLNRVTSKSITPSPHLVSGTRLVDGVRDQIYWFVPYDGKKIEREVEGRRIIETLPLDPERKAAVLRGVLNTSEAIQKNLSYYLYALLTFKSTDREGESFYDFMAQNPDRVRAEVKKSQKRIANKLQEAGIPRRLDALISFAIGEGKIFDEYADVRREEREEAERTGVPHLPTISSRIVCSRDLADRLTDLRLHIGDQIRTGEYPEPAGRVFTDEGTIRILIDRLATKDGTDPKLEALAGKPLYVESGSVKWGKEQTEFRFLHAIALRSNARQKGFAPIFGRERLAEHDVEIAQKQAEDRAYRQLVDQASTMRRRYMLKEEAFSLKFHEKIGVRGTKEFMQTFFDEYTALSRQVWSRLKTKTRNKKGTISLTSEQATAIRNRIQFADEEDKPTNKQKITYLQEFNHHLTPTKKTGVYEFTYDTGIFKHAEEFIDASIMLQYAFNDHSTTWTLERDGVEESYRDWLKRSMSLTTISDVALDYLETNGKINLLTSRQQGFFNRMDDSPDPNTAHIISPTDLGEIIAATAWAVALEKTGLKEHDWISREYGQITGSYTLEMELLKEINCTYENKRPTNPNAPSW